MKKTKIKTPSPPNSRFEFGYLGEELTADQRWHMPARFILARKNRIKLRVEGKEYALSAGNVLLVWPGEEFEILTVPREGALALQFSSSCITECDDICTVYHYLNTVRLLDDSQAELRDTVSQFLLHAFKVEQDQELFYETRVRIDILEILIEVAKAARENSMKAQSVEIISRNSASKMEKACSYITANCDKRITQAEVAENVGISTFYFSRLFRQYTGKSFNDYLNEHRIQKALMLLSNRRISIQDVAVNSGFQSISNFNKVFKKHVGCSPNEYRRIHEIRTRK